MMSAEFLVHLANCGFRLDAPAVADGKLRRVAWHGRKAFDKTGWYVLHSSPDGWEAAAWGDWRENRNETWTSKEPRKVSSLARAAMESAIKKAKEAAAAEKLKAAEAAVGRAWVIWANGEPAVEHEHDYLTRKNITGHGLRVTRGELVVPLRDAGGILRNVQRIAPDGRKRFLKEAAVSGLAWVRGTLPESGGDVVICEGMATAATLAALSGAPVVAAMNAGNLCAVAAWVRERCPEARILIGADDDRWERDGTPRPAEKNVGMVKAAAAAAAVRGLVAAPVFSDVASRGTDWNDLLCEEGEMSARAKWATALSVSMLDAQVAAMGEVEFAQRKPQLTAAYRAAGAGAVGPKLLDAKRKEAKSKSPGADGDAPAAVMARLVSEPELWRDQFGQAFATFELDGRRVNAEIGGETFRDWLRMAFEDETGSAVPPSRELVNSAIEQAAARARTRGAAFDGFFRVGWNERARYLDLGGEDWAVVEFGAQGWSVLVESPVKFVRGDGDCALPIPKANGRGLDPLWSMLNVAEADRCLVAGWLLCSLLGTAPAFGLNLHGSQGTAKSTATRILRRIVDPAPGLTQALNLRKVDELPLTCRKQWIPCFENLSWLEDEIQDALCMLSTGLSTKNRKLYTDGSIISSTVRRPWIVNGINNVCSRNDLAERAVPVALMSLDPTKRRREEAIEEEFAEAWPGLLATLLDAASMASLPESRKAAEELLGSKGLNHRMMDALVWITSGEELLGFAPGSFIRRLNSLQEDAGREALAEHPLVVAIQALLEARAEQTSEWTSGEEQEWTGGNDELFDKMLEFCPNNRPIKGCEDARKLGMWLRREAGRLRVSFKLDVGESHFIAAGGGRSKRVRTIRNLATKSHE